MRAGRRATVVALVATLAVARVGVAPPERCPAVPASDARSSVVAAVGWLAEHQRPDGRWAYLLTEGGADLGGYSAVRHAGVLLSLYQAVSAGVPGARAVAERGLSWAADNLVPTGEGVALAEATGSVQTGGAALLALALLERRSTGPADPARDRLLEDLGTFLAGQVEASGAVLAAWDPTTGAPVPGLYSAFFTGEALWALVRLDAAFPDGGWQAPVDAVLTYLPDRDAAEDRFPPTSDHWAAYALADLGADRLDGTTRAYARRLAGIVGIQVRAESTRWRGGLQGLLRRGPAVGSGVGTLGEAGAALLRLDVDPSGLAERVRCTAGMLVARQAGGAWFTEGVTRMDDQQHAISALVAAEPVLAAGAEARVGGGEDPRGLLWVVLAAIAVANPAARKTGPRRSWLPGGGLVVGVAGLALASGPLLDALAVSPASARIAAGVAAVATGLAALVRPRSPSGDGIAVGAGLLLALGAGADDGVAVVTVAAGVAAAALALLPERWCRPAVWAPIGLVAVLVGVDLAVDGVLGV